MWLGDIADSLGRTVEGVTGAVNEALFEPTIRLGVTGLSRAGKTVFITSLIANLLDRSRMPGLAAAADGRVRAAYLQPQPDDTVPRFEYETHLSALLGPEPIWPDSTRSVSELRLSLRLQPAGLIGSVSGPRRLHLDIVDYPGEWLLDLGLLEVDFTEWSSRALTAMEGKPFATAYLERLAATSPGERLVETEAQDLAGTYTEYLHSARASGFSNIAPGRFLLPGDLAGSPALTFAPLPPSAAARGSLAREMARRFEAYKTLVVKPFFRDHLSRIDRQVVLIDALGALARGPAATADLIDAMGGILSAFRPGRNAFLAQIFLGKRVEKILFAATKADTLHHSQHVALASVAEALARAARDRADFAGAGTSSMAIAALRTTTEETREEGGASLDMVRGRVVGRDGLVAVYPGTLPASGSEVVAAATANAESWPWGDVEAMDFLPQPLRLSPGEGPPHIRLDRAAEFLFGDRL
ncbi:MAG: YcjX family protein [Pseudomonadota bacterium]